MSKENLPKKQGVFIFWLAREEKRHRLAGIFVFSLMKLFNITDIFNNIITMSSDTLEAFHDELRKSYKKLKKDHDVDNLRVLKNRIQTVIDGNVKKLSHKEQHKLEKLQEIVREIDDTIVEIEAIQRQAVAPIDLEKKFDKKYKALKKLPKGKRRSHVLIAMKRSDIRYEEEILTLQLELAKLQKYIQETGKKLLIIFEGRDAAGKGGNIKRFTESLNPRYARTVALMKPSDLEK